MLIFIYNGHASATCKLINSSYFTMLKERMNTSYMSEYILGEEAGVDESNRGGLIFDVFASCVLLPTSFPDNKYLQIKDSKKLSRKKRAELAEYIMQHAITFGVASVSSAEIDSTNILKATMKAMYKAIDIAYKKHSFKKLVIDGNRFDGYTPPGEDSELLEHECIVKGDAKWLNIAAASILAKHSHDTMLIKLVDDNPELEKYDLRKNQGYGTPRHLLAIREHGITRFHRKSFAPCKDYA